MGKFIVSEDFWERFPEAEIAIVSAKFIRDSEKENCLDEVCKIDPLMNIYSSISIAYGLPSRMEGYENTMPGEIDFIDDDGCLCRCWNWCDSQRIIRTEDTADAFLIMESINPDRNRELKDAAEALAKLINKYLNGITAIYYMNKKNKEFKIPSGS